ncbi:tetratricopeptide repeat protein [Luteolibacter sp. AS25]|uniref:tetratricopeptide repeat protein n=1 Tax=Luteolibacter sp. AS25 TaxID=3135776 RepID=UPI00398B401C
MAENSSELKFFSQKGQEVIRQKGVGDKRIVELESACTEFFIYFNVWERGSKNEKIYFQIVDIEVDARSTFDVHLENDLNAGVMNADKVTVDPPKVRLERGTDRKTDSKAKVKNTVKVPSKSVTTKENLLNGWMKFNGGNYQEAIALFEAVITQKPESANVLRVCAEAYVKLNKEAEALLLLEKARDLLPKNKNIGSRISFLQSSGFKRRFMRPCEFRK